MKMRHPCLFSTALLLGALSWPLAAWQADEEKPSGHPVATVKLRPAAHGDLGVTVETMGVQKPIDLNAVLVHGLNCDWRPGDSDEYYLEGTCRRYLHVDHGAVDDKLALAPLAAALNEAGFVVVRFEMLGKGEAVTSPGVNWAKMHIDGSPTRPAQDYWAFIAIGKLVPPPIQVKFGERVETESPGRTTDPGAVRTGAAGDVGTPQDGPQGIGAGVGIGLAELDHVGGVAVLDLGGTRGRCERLRLGITTGERRGNVADGCNAVRTAATARNGDVPADAGSGRSTWNGSAHSDDAPASADDRRGGDLHRSARTVSDGQHDDGGRVEDRHAEHGRGIRSVPPAVLVYLAVGLAAHAPDGLGRIAGSRL